MSACDPSEVVTASDGIDDSLSVCSVLDLLEGHRIEILVSLMPVE